MKKNHARECLLLATVVARLIGCCSKQVSSDPTASSRMLYVSAHQETILVCSLHSGSPTSPYNMCCTMGSMSFQLSWTVSSCLSARSRCADLTSLLHSAIRRYGHLLGIGVLQVGEAQSSHATSLLPLITSPRSSLPITPRWCSGSGHGAQLQFTIFDELSGRPDPET